MQVKLKLKNILNSVHLWFFVEWEILTSDKNQVCQPHRSRAMCNSSYMYCTIWKYILQLAYILGSLLK